MERVLPHCYIAVTKLLSLQLKLGTSPCLSPSPHRRGRRVFYDSQNILVEGEVNNLLPIFPEPTSSPRQVLLLKWVEICTARKAGRCKVYLVLPGFLLFIAHHRKKMEAPRSTGVRTVGGAFSGPNKENWAEGWRGAQENRKRDDVPEAKGPRCFRLRKKAEGKPRRSPLDTEASFREPVWTFYVPRRFLREENTKFVLREN